MPKITDIQQLSIPSHYSPSQLDSAFGLFQLGCNWRVQCGFTYRSTVSFKTAGASKIQAHAIYMGLKGSKIKRNGKFRTPRSESMWEVLLMNMSKEEMVAAL
jgi:hypothetical protein